MPIVTAQFKDATTDLPIANLPVQVIVRGGCGLLWLGNYATWSNTTTYYTDGNGEVNITTAPLNPQCFEQFTFKVLPNQYYESESFSRSINGLGSQSATWTFYVTPINIQEEGKPTETVTLSNASSTLSNALRKLGSATWESIALLIAIAVLIFAIGYFIAKWRGLV